MSKRKFQCVMCEHFMDVPFDVARPTHCPMCNSTHIHCVDHDLCHIHNEGKRKGRGGRRRVRSWDSWMSKGNKNVGSRR
ncbi:MAG: hypothetical protein OEV44_05865 [Spirochaetota bacterium]|nr:hypothetical protein [Spirochaetota bacterium]